MPNEFNELENQPQGQPGEELQNQPAPEPEPELSPFDRVLQNLPEDERKVVEEGYLRNKDYTQKQQRLSEERKRLERERAAIQRKADFYDKFVEDPGYRKQVLEAFGEKQIPQRSDNFEERYEKAQEIVNNLDRDSRTAIDYLIEKKLRDKISPINEKLAAAEQREEERRQQKLQQLNQERQKVLREFATECPDYVDVEAEMEGIISGFPGFFNQTPAQLSKTLRHVYKMANMPKLEQKAKEKGIQAMLDKNIKAQEKSSKAIVRPSPGKTFPTKKEGMSFDECFDAVWSEKVGE